MNAAKVRGFDLRRLISPGAFPRPPDGADSPTRPTRVCLSRVRWRIPHLKWNKVTTIGNLCILRHIATEIQWLTCGSFGAGAGQTSGSLVGSCKILFKLLNIAYIWSSLLIAHNTSKLCIDRGPTDWVSCWLPLMRRQLKSLHYFYRTLNMLRVCMMFFTTSYSWATCARCSKYKCSLFQVPFIGHYLPLPVSVATSSF